MSLNEQCNYHLNIFIDIKHNENASLNEIVETFGKIEEFGTKSLVTKGPFSSKHNKQIDFIKQSIQHDGTHYRINLPWKYDITNQTNKAQLESLQRQLQKDKLTMQHFDQSSSTDADKGYVIPVTFLHLPPLRIWYLTHHPVINHQKPGKNRRVTNGAKSCLKSC